MFVVKAPRPFVQKYGCHKKAQAAPELFASSFASFVLFCGIVGFRPGSTEDS
jgi:hypothetical protein